MRVVLFCTDQYPPDPHGGIGTFTHTYAHGLAALGHGVTVVVRGSRAAERRDGPVRVVWLPTTTVPRVSWLVNRLRAYRWVRREMRAEGVDVVEVPDHWGMLPFRLRGCPVVVRLHITALSIMRDAGLRPSASLRWCERRNLEVSGQWIAVSRWALQHTRSLFALTERRSAVIYYPLVVPEPNPDIAGRLPREFVLYAGTVNRRKGALCLARAAKEVMAARPELHLVYAGGLTGDDPPGVDDRIREILGDDLAGRVHFLGHVDRGGVYYAMTRARVFAFPSTLETFGLVVSEAMLAGCPVIASTAGPFPEFVTDGETGQLVAPEDPAALRDALARALENGADLAAMTARARASITQQLSLSRCLERSLDFYGACRA